MKVLRKFWLWFCVACLMLSGCSSNLGGSYTRLYPVTDYLIKADGVDAVFTVEDNKEDSMYFRRYAVYLHDGEDTVIVISADKDGKGLSGVKNVYLYLNAEKVAEQIKDKGGSW